MNKTLKLIERILFYTYIFFLVFGAWLVFAAGYINNFRDVIHASRFLFQDLFSKAAMRNLLIIFIVIIVFAFAGLWIRAGVALKSFSFGPIYLILFFVTFLFTNGYYNSVPEINLDAKILAITSGLLLFNLFYSMVVFFITTNPVKQIQSEEVTPSFEEQTQAQEALSEEESNTEPAVVPEEPKAQEEPVQEEPTEETTEESTEQEEEPVQEETMEETPVQEELTEEPVPEEVQAEESNEEQAEDETPSDESLEEPTEDETPSDEMVQEETQEDAEPAEEVTEDDIYTAEEPEKVSEINEDELADPLDNDNNTSDENEEKLDASEALDIVPSYDTKTEETLDEEPKEAQEDENDEDKDNVTRSIDDEPFEKHIGESLKEAKKIDYLEDNWKQELLISNQFIKKAYSDIRNILDDYGFKRKCGRRCEEFFASNELAIRITLFDRALRLYVNLEESECKAKYSLINYSNNYGYQRVKYMFKINNKKTLSLGKELINDIVEKFNVSHTPDFTEFDFEGYLTENSEEKLLSLGFNKDGFLKTADVNNVNGLNDEMARLAMLHEKSLTDINKTSIYSITIGELSAAFKSSYVIDLPLLKKIGIVPKSTTYLRVINGGRCTKQLTIKANEYETRALKQILLTKGNPYQVI